MSSRLERNQKNYKQFHWQTPIIALLLCLLLVGGYFGFQSYLNRTTHVDSPIPKLGRKVVVHLPNGNEVFTYEKYIVKKNGKIFYKGDQDTIDLTGGKVEYKDWK